MNAEETLASVDDDKALAGSLEAVLLVANEPVEPAVLAQLLEIPTTRVIEICEQLVADYARDRRGFTIGRVAGGYRFQTVAEQAPYVERFVLEGQVARLSGPALETLAIIAYKQPISRAQLSAIRGVNVDATVRTLAQRGYVEESGHEPTPGNPALFSTTRTFLEKLGVNSLDDLPPLADYIPDANVVEALERGLRIVDPATELSDDAGDAAGASPGASPGATVTTVDGDVIDLNTADLPTPAEMMETLGQERVSMSILGAMATGVAPQSSAEFADSPDREAAEISVTTDDVAADLALGIDEA